MKKFIKARRWKRYLWTLIILKFFDIITTSIGVGMMNAKELNPLGYDFVMILSILYLPLLYIMTTLFDKKPFMMTKKFHYHTRIGIIKHYKLMITIIMFDIITYTIVFINNMYQLLL